MVIPCCCDDATLCCTHRKFENEETTGTSSLFLPETVWSRHVEPNTGTVAGFCGNGSVSEHTVASNGGTGSEDEVLYLLGIAAGTHVLQAWSATGLLLWETGVGFFRYGKLVCDGTTVFVCGRTQLLSGEDRLLVAFDASTGTILWSKSATDLSTLMSLSVALDGTGGCFLGTEDSTVWRFDASGTEISSFDLLALSSGVRHEPYCMLVVGSSLWIGLGPTISVVSVCDLTVSSKLVRYSFDGELEVIAIDQREDSDTSFSPALLYPNRLAAIGNRLFCGYRYSDSSGNSSLGATLVGKTSNFPDIVEWASETGAFVQGFNVN